ncbi:MAG: hypothetical protein KIT09_03210 [Bryobacteraceae bacterium]|nr:hypothetical protein [Bryobacteraceae bacterium]
MLWAITSYFNPAGFQCRLRNYRVFRRHLGVPLVAVELSFDGRFELCPGDADVLVQLHGGDVLWQKERLLNIALASVPAEAEAVAWVDCDVIFEREDWADKAREALAGCSLVHLYHERHDLPCGVMPDQLRGWDRPCTSRSTVHLMAAGVSEPHDFYLAGAPLERRSTLGLAWASRRDILEAHGLYDACILGSGDRAIACGALGRFDWAERALKMNGPRREHYLRWARPYFAAIGGRVGCIEGRLYHLWHGDLRLRRYAERLDCLETFDPFTDIALEANGCWRWSSDKQELHLRVREYFASRNEDSESVAQPC